MKWIALVFGLFIIGIIVLANMDMLGVLGFINQIPYGDKIGHFVLYGILTLLVDLAFFRSHPDLSRSLIVLRVTFILAVLIGLEEYMQRYFASRTSDWVDLAFSYTGVMFFSWFTLRKK